MKIQYVSDIHNEVRSTFMYEQTDADIVVIAGDLDVGNKGLQWIERNINDKPVIYVLGNHEYYACKHPDLINQLKRESAGTNIHVLENDMVTIDGVNFHGCSLWTDYELNQQGHKDRDACRDLLQDYSFIVDSSTGKKFSPERAVELHVESLCWLSQSLQVHKNELNVVVTHHAPDLQSLAAYKHTKVYAPAYVTRLSEFIKEHSPALWIHGHCHKVSRYQIQSTTVVCNPRGSNTYVDDFDPEACIVVPLLK